MKGKNWTIPFGMVLKKYYCSNCGTRLQKERLHRVVTKDDKDYYQYHDYNNFPRYDHDVYSYRFKCPSCLKRISFKEQCIIERIQKTKNTKILSLDEIKDNYNCSKYKDNKRVLIRNIVIFLIFTIILFIISYITIEKTKENLLIIIGLLSLFTVINIVGIIKRYNGSYKLKIYKGYSHEEESKLEILHAYSSHNRDLIMSANKCYCFHCLKVVESRMVNEYIDDNQTALCPYCHVDTLIPDSIDQLIDDEAIEKMHKYWF